jgi:hypothetical protein
VHREEIRQRIEAEQPLMVMPAGEHVALGCEASCC